MKKNMIFLLILIRIESNQKSYFRQVGFAVWIWAIYGTFPGTYSTQPAITTQAFGHKFGGTIYGFLFTSDIINNLLVADHTGQDDFLTIFLKVGSLSRWLLDAGGWLGFFVCLSGFGAVALIVTAFFPGQDLSACEGKSFIVLFHIT